ncbi:hypothetical protein C8P68_10567 [Mucilaginibacter yixingensis]|uniref:TonB-like protein n=1 Tax=Mucilaginibacter yixingensis TaxID=1295612 RepID=A0A2T5J807_9SPHI|nr:hypothetical protein [Mucilaginibacter yixingensis]PTQ95562.1 hypothetical protein C8P68_10567 [Mucilaginibacter yixingensis]
MKKLFLMLMAVMAFGRVMAQAEMDFPFQGGKDVMTDFFAKNILVSDQIRSHANTGLVVMKFTSDVQGSIIKMVVYYADDANLTIPVVAALKATNGKWIIPARQKTYDFIIPFSFSMNKPDAKSSKAILQYLGHRTPITADDQIPLNTVTLLPTVKVVYDFLAPVKKVTK